MTEGTSVYHDCPLDEVLISQVRNLGSRFASPFGVRLEVFGFQGSFLSISIPVDFEAELQQEDHLMLRIELTSEVDCGSYVRLNLEKGSQKEEQTLTAEKRDKYMYAEFDLATFQTNLDGTQRVWFDLSFDNYKHNAITIRDLSVFSIKKMRL